MKYSDQIKPISYLKANAAATLKRYASALSYRLQVRLFKDRGLTNRSTRRTKPARAG